jgi:hypothetical protein
LLDIKAIFNFAAKDPIMALIVGGILIAVLSVLVTPINPEIAKALLSLGTFLAIFGGLLYIVKLFIQSK